MKLFNKYNNNIDLIKQVESDNKFNRDLDTIITTRMLKLAEDKRKVSAQSPAKPPLVSIDI